MEQISISKFRAICLAVLERVRRSREPALVMKSGFRLLRSSLHPR
jgi:hypothetical protein